LKTFCDSGHETGWGEPCLECVRIAERKKWSHWIGDILTVQHPNDKALLWGIAEAIDNNNFGTVADVKAKKP